MKTFFYAFLFLFAFLGTACNNTASNDELIQITQGCTKAEVTFFGNKEKNYADYLATTVTTQAQMSQLASYVSATDVELKNCRLDGKMVFYDVDAVKVELQFSLQEQCVLFTYKIGEKTLTKKMTHKGKLHMDELLQGASGQWQSKM